MTVGVQTETRQAGHDVARLRDLSPQQWKSGIAAWLGWLFDGLDMHLYTVVATPFVALLLTVDPANPVGEKAPEVGFYSSIIQAAFLVGWALGGGFFGRIGDRLGRARALMLTILTYAAFTGLSFFAQTWWHLLICRFLAALGIGGGWAGGASLFSETWPRRWRPGVGALLQTAVNCGIMVAMVCVLVLSQVTSSQRYVFLVGIAPALIVLWIRRAVPETEEWHAAREQAGGKPPGAIDLFRGSVRRTTILTILVCAFSLTAHWAFMFWFQQHLRNLPELDARAQASYGEYRQSDEATEKPLTLEDWTDRQKKQAATTAMMIVMITSVIGNFLAAFLARLAGYRRAIFLMFVAYFLAMFLTYLVPLEYEALLWCYVPIGICQGAFALFTMYLPPLFPTLLRTTGAGFCYNIGRIAAAAGTVFFGLFSAVGDHRVVLLYASFMFLPAAGVAMLLSEPPDERAKVG
jgi:MFS family permease